MRLNASYTRYIVLAVAGAVLITGLAWPKLSIVYERAAMRMSPSAERAALYGSRHLDATHPAAYDIAWAEALYRTALQLDPMQTEAHHQLARIEFLNGNLNTALYLIDRQLELHGDTVFSSHYIRGLILGYMGRYEESAESYARFLGRHETNWAALNDYAWVLLKAGRSADAARALEAGLQNFPDNPWLHNSLAIALTEQGALVPARVHALAAVQLAAAVTREEWLQAYPGNDPAVAAQGIATLQQSTAENVHRIEHALLAAGVE